MRSFTWAAMVFLYVATAVLTTAAVGKPRKPLTPADAAGSIGIVAVLIVAITYIYMT